LAQSAAHFVGDEYAAIAGIERRGVSTFFCTREPMRFTTPNDAWQSYTEKPHHVEARDAVIDAIKKLDTLYVALAPAQETKRKRLRDWDRVLNVQRYTLEEPTNRIHSIRYELGTWFGRWKDDHVLAPRRILQLDAKRDASAKTLARYFTQRRREAEASGRIVRRVRNVFVETASEIERGKNPQRLRDWIEQSLETLRRDGIIAAWSVCGRCGFANALQMARAVA